jgi:hypothetical protein
VDHGVCFSEEPKLRTVIWDFIGEPIDASIRADLGRLEGELRSGSARAELTPLLSAAELDALVERVAEMAALKRFPEPGPDRRPFPWPPI